MKVSLTDICDFQGGTQPPKDEWIDQPAQGYVRMLQIRDFTQSDKNYIEYVKDTGKLKTCIEDDILIGRYGASIGKILTGLAGAYNVAIVKTIPDEKVVSKKYLYWYLNSQYFQRFISNVGSRAAQAGFNKNDLGAAQIPLVDKERQEEICEVLEKANKLISLRKQQLAKLDELVKARFVEMFGSYPENENAYPVVNVSDIADAGVGVVIKPAQYYVTEERGIKAFRSLNIGEMYIKDSDWVYFSKEGNESNKKSQLHENDLLIVRSGAPGTSCVVTKEFEGCNAVDVIIAHPNLSKVNPWYLCAYINYPHGKKQIEEGTGGAAQQHFNVGKCNNLKVLLPPLEPQNLFAAFVERVNQQKQTVQQSLEKLELMKKALMQEYFG